MLKQMNSVCIYKIVWWKISAASKRDFLLWPLIISSSTSRSHQTKKMLVALRRLRLLNTNTNLAPVKYEVFSLPR